MIFHDGMIPRNSFKSSPDSLKSDLLSLANPAKAKLLSGFFKTGKGQYGEGDLFLGLTVPQQRSIAKQYLGISIDALMAFLKSPYHEFRLTALIILVYKYEDATCANNQWVQKQIYEFYLKNIFAANNWDLVDVTCPRIIGAYLYTQSRLARKLLYRLARSKNLWEKRIAIISTAYFISKGEFDDTFAIAEILLHDDHDLIHKAVGWMLREVGKRNQAVEEKFLQQYAKVMPRTMLRYAIERFDEKERKSYLSY